MDVIDTACLQQNEQEDGHHNMEHVADVEDLVEVAIGFASLYVDETNGCARERTGNKGKKDYDTSNDTVQTKIGYAEGFEGQARGEKTQEHLKDQLAINDQGVLGDAFITATVVL